MKACTRCGEVKPLDQFSRQTANKDGLAYMCRTCKSAAGKARYQAKREHALEVMRKYRAANVERIRAFDRAYAKAHREEATARRRQWELDNPERAREIRIASQKRQADKRAARQQARESAIRAGQRGHKCEVVGSIYAVARAWRAAGFSVHVDHVHPIARGGRHEWQNLNILPAAVNLKKGARHA